MITGTKMKRHVFIFTLLLCATFLWAQVSSKPAELDIYNNLNIYSNAGYYPGVVVQAELLENNYPESVFIVEPNRNGAVYPTT